MRTILMYTRKFAGLVLVVAICMFSLAAEAATAKLDWVATFPKLADGKVLLMWDSAAGADKYKVYRKRGNGEYQLLTTPDANRHIDSDVQPGNQYTYKVVATKGGSEIAVSEEKKLTIAAEKVYVPLSTPKLMDAILRAESGGGEVVGMRWEVDARATDLAGYNIYRGLKKGGPYDLIGTSQSHDYVDSDVKRGKTYYYVVSAIDNNFKETPYSNVKEVEVPEVEVKVPKGKEPTPLRRARHLFDIKKYKDGEKEFNLEFPIDVVVDEAVGHIYVVTRHYGGILVYDLDGKFQFGIRRDGVNSKVKIRGIHGLALGPEGLIYVSDYLTPFVYAYDFRGEQKKVIEINLKDTIGIEGKKASVFDLAVNSMGDIYMSETQTDRILVYDSRGRFRRSFGKFSEKDREKIFSGPTFSAFDRNDNFLIIDSSVGRLLAYDTNDKFVAMPAAPSLQGMGDAGRLFFPSGVAVDAEGRMLVANSLDPNVQAFDMKGNFLYAVSNENLDGPIKSNDIRGIYVDSKDRLYVCEVLSKTVAVYQLVGEPELITIPSNVEK